MNYLTDLYVGSPPIVVTSPTSRCGTTLLQRLLSDSPSAFIYGEEVGVHMKVLTTWFLDVIRNLEKNGPTHDKEFAQAFEGTLEDWRPALPPPSSVMLRACAETYYPFSYRLSEYNRSIGRPIWGFKCPGFEHDTLVAMLAFLPGAKVIYLIRNPFDALRSAKARRFVTTRAQAEAFCAEWARNVAEAGDLESNPAVLVLKYEDLVTERSASIQRLRTFTGIEHLTEREFARKINTFRGEVREGHSPDRYIPPAALSPDETALVRDVAGAMIEKIYGPAVLA